MSIDFHNNDYGNLLDSSNKISKNSEEEFQTEDDIEFSDEDEDQNLETDIGILTKIKNWVCNHPIDTFFISVFSSVVAGYFINKPNPLEIIDCNTIGDDNSYSKRLELVDTIRDMMHNKKSECSAARRLTEVKNGWCKLSKKKQDRAIKDYRNGNFNNCNAKLYKEAVDAYCSEYCKSFHYYHNKKTDTHVLYINATGLGCKDELSQYKTIGCGALLGYLGERLFGTKFIDSQDISNAINESQVVKDFFKQKGNNKEIIAMGGSLGGIRIIKTLEKMSKLYKYELADCKITTIFNDVPLSIASYNDVKTLKTVKANSYVLTAFSWATIVDRIFLNIKDDVKPIIINSTAIANIQKNRDVDYHNAAMNAVYNKPEEAIIGDCCAKGQGVDVT